MAEKKRKARFKPDCLVWIMVALVFVLVVEAAVAGVSVFGAVGARGNITLSHAASQSRTEGVSLYDLGRDFEINNAFLMRLMELAKSDCNVVRLSMNVGERITFDSNGAQVDGNWLYQTASLAEMVFQSEYRVTLALELVEDERFDAQAWLGLWKQVDSAYGHRPADELSYELTISPDRMDAAWNAARREVIEAMRATNGERSIVVSLPQTANAAMLAEVETLCSDYGVQLGLLTDAVPDEKLLSKLDQIAYGSNTVLVLIEAEDAAIGEALRTAADSCNAGYLLQGD